MKAFKTLYEILDHIKDVELETIELSKSSSLKISTFLEKNGIAIDDEVSDALQYQDIISQQLNATIEAIQYVQSHLKLFESVFDTDEGLVNNNVNRLHNKLNVALETAKEKREAFSGKVNSEDEDEIEFF